MEENEDTPEEETPVEPETYIPDVDINIDETPSDESFSGEETSEEAEEEFTGFDSSENFVPSTRFSSRANPNIFLEQESVEPVDNLEREFQGISNRQANNQPEVVNAPQYSSYEGSYDQAPTDSVYPERFSSTINAPSHDFIAPMNQGQVNMSSDLAPGRLLNPSDTMGWRNESRIQSWDRDEDRKYSTDLGRKKSRNDW